MTKIIKTAAALALGASIVTTAFVPADASAAPKYKVKSGKLIVVKTGKLATGTVTFNKIVYKKGIKLNGLKGAIYYKAGKKATGTYKGAYYVNGAKKVTTGTYNKAYYVKGIKKVTTGLYANKYYKVGKLATGTYKSAYYVNGIKKVTTGTYNKAYYVKGVKKVATGTFEKAYYVDGVKKVETGTYEKAYYVDGVKKVETGFLEGKFYFEGALNIGYKLYENKLYKDADLNVGLTKFEDKYYKDAELADGTFEYEGKEEAFEKGIKVGAKVASVQAISATQLKVTFNKTVDAASAVKASDAKPVTGTVNIKKVLATPEILDVKKAVVDGKTITYTVDKELQGEYTIEIDKLQTAGKESIARYSEVVKFEADRVAPNVTSVVKENAKTYSVNFSEPISTGGNWTFKNSRGENVSVTVEKVLTNDDQTLTLTIADTVLAGTQITATAVGVLDKNNNLLNPNPFTTTITKGERDGIAPTVASVTQTGAKEFTVIASEAVNVATTPKAFKLTNATNQDIADTIVQDTKDKTKFVITSADFLNGLYTLSAEQGALTDNSGEKSAEYSKVVVFTKDITAAKIAKSEIVTDAGVRYVDLTFDKNVVIPMTATDAATIKVSGTVLDKNYVTTPISKTLTATNQTTSEINYKSTTDKKVVRVKLVDLVGTGVAGNKYNINLTAANFKTEADIVSSATSSLAFDWVVDTVITNDELGAPKVAQFKKDNKDVPGFLTVEFTGQVDGATATNSNNYKVDGAAVKKATLGSYNSTTNTQVVTLELVENSNEYTGFRPILVRNVKLLGSTKTMKDFYENGVSIIENTAAKIETAKLTVPKTITVTFNEAVLATIPETAFTLKSGNNVIAILKGTINGNTITLTTTEDLTAAQVEAGLTLTKGDTNITDIVGNVTDVIPTAVAR